MGYIGTTIRELEKDDSNASIDRRWSTTLENSFCAVR